MKRSLVAGLVVVVAAGSFVAGHVAAQDNKKPANVPNADEALAKDEEYQKADLAKKLEHLKKLSDEKKLDHNQHRWMAVRAILAEARAQKIDGDLVAFSKWLGAHRKDSNSAIYKNGRDALGDIVDVVGTDRLYKDEAFQKGDLPAKMKRVLELWTAKEIGQGVAYELTNDLVYRHLAPAGGDIDKELAMFGELYRKDVLVWESTGSIHRALLTRALHEKKELDSLDKKLAFINKVSKSKEGDIAWMVVGNLRVVLLMIAIDGDAEFTKLDAAGRKDKIEAWAKEGKIQSSDRSALFAAYTVAK